MESYEFSTRPNYVSSEKARFAIREKIATNLADANIFLWKNNNLFIILLYFSFVSITLDYIRSTIVVTHDRVCNFRRIIYLGAAF